MAPDSPHHELAHATFRLARADDAPILWHMLTYAASMGPDLEASIAGAQADETLRSYVAGWMRAGDLGVVAVASHGAAIGAAWLRLAEEGTSSKLNKVATADEPELAIGVVPAARGAGVGGRLLAELIEHARPRYPAMVLTVRNENPSVRLYERAGFAAVRHTVNRVGGSSWVMRRAL